MTYQVIIPKPVQKQLNRLPQDRYDAVLARIMQLSDNPRPSGTKKLKGHSDEYRIRMGDYRVRYEINDQKLILLILSCRHRKDAYRT